MESTYPRSPRTSRATDLVGRVGLLGRTNALTSRPSVAATTSVSTAEDIV